MKAKFTTHTTQTLDLEIDGQEYHDLELPHKIEALETYAKKVDDMTLRVSIVSYDSFPSSPREDDNLGTIVGWHRDYHLSDEKMTLERNNWLAQQVWELVKGQEHLFVNGDKWSVDDLWQDYITNEEAEALWPLFLKAHLVLPLYLYEHGNVYLRPSSSFNDAWDSRDVGFIYISHAKIRAEFGWKNLTAKRLEQIAGYLRGEVETYSDYLNGSVYEVILLEYYFDYDTETWELAENERCGGYYGCAYALQTAQEEL